MSVKGAGPWQGVMRADHPRTSTSSHLGLGDQSLRMDSSSLVGREAGDWTHPLVEMGLYSFLLSSPRWAGSKQPASLQALWLRSTRISGFQERLGPLSPEL